MNCLFPNRSIWHAFNWTQPVSFFNDLAAFLKKQEVKDIVILTGMFSSTKARDTSKFYYLANDRYQLQHKEQLKNSQRIERSEKTKAKAETFSHKLYEQISDSISSCILMKYSGGCDRIDAVKMAEQVNMLVGDVLYSSGNQGEQPLDIVTMK